MGVLDDPLVVVVGDVIELIEDLLLHALLLGGGLPLQRQVLSDPHLPRVEKLLHHTHELDELLGDDFESGLGVAGEHLGVAVVELSDFLDAVERQAQVILLHKNIQNVVLVYAQNTA